MMRGRRHIAVAVRRPGGDIVVHTEPLHTAYTSRWARLPLVRGVFVLAETLVLGMRSLLWSANVQLEQEQAQIGGAGVWGMLLLALAVAVGLFFVGPLLAVHWIDRYITSSIVSNLIEGAIRLLIFLAYLWVIGFLPDIRRVFAYHGAEHKTINAFEAGTLEDPQSAQAYSTAHPRCGTAFLLWVVVLSVLVFALLGRPDFWLRIASRVVLVPVIAALGYEIVRFFGAHRRNAIVRVLMYPSLALQRMTTRAPDGPMLEVALTALENARAADARAVPVEG